MATMHVDSVMNHEERLQHSHRKQLYISNKGTETEERESTNLSGIINSIKLHSGVLLAPQTHPTMLLASV